MAVTRTGRLFKCDGLTVDPFSSVNKTSIRFNNFKSHEKKRQFIRVSHIESAVMLEDVMFQDIS